MDTNDVKSKEERKNWAVPIFEVIDIESETLSTGNPTGGDGYNTYS